MINRAIKHIPLGAGEAEGREGVLGVNAAAAPVRLVAQPMTHGVATRHRRFQIRASFVRAAEQQKTSKSILPYVPSGSARGIVDHSPTMSLTDTCRKSLIRVPSFASFSLSLSPPAFSSSSIFSPFLSFHRRHDVSRASGKNMQ